jgi:hypothetical protein
MAGTAILERAQVVRHGRRLKYFTIVWNPRRFDSMVRSQAASLL